ncbi:Carboxypeptidase S [Yarrowia sp. C11]|nr:Carboxypeptidase S [Yarrowia sp. C11]
MEKHQLNELDPVAAQQQHYVAPTTPSWKKIGFFVVSALTVGSVVCKSGVSTKCLNHMSGGSSSSSGDSLCPSQAKLVPEGFTNLDFILHDEKYHDHALKTFQGAIQIPTESYDDMGPVGEEPRFDIFKNFSSYVEKSFPTVYSKLEVEHVNTYGLVFTWKGSNKDLKPQLLMAHQDVVPVNADTEKKWTHPPFSGHYDGKYIWGRGTVDTKNTVIGSLAAVELLLKEGYTPERTHILGFGFDEEISGPQGAKFIAEHLYEKYGEKSLFAILDEGSGILETEEYAMIVAATGEKGYLDVSISVNVAGGHSSMPPPHTGIGLAALIIAEIEKTPYKPLLTQQNPFFYTLQCVADHDPSLSDAVKTLIRKSGNDLIANKKLVSILSANPKYRDLIRTTQAVDIINGGVKSNALPETTTFIVNQRIEIESGVSDAKDKMIKNVLDIARQHDLSVSAFGDFIIEGKSGQVDIELFGLPLEVAPQAPVSGPTWDLIVGTALHVFKDAVFPEDYNVFAAPGIMTGNTDTRHYWALTDAIYRFNPVRESAAFGIHTVDEHLEFQSHLETIAYYYEFIKNGEHFSK